MGFWTFALMVLTGASFWWLTGQFWAGVYLFLAMVVIKFVNHLIAENVL
jgi:hypothetical protein